MLRTQMFPGLPPRTTLSRTQNVCPRHKIVSEFFQNNNMFHRLLPPLLLPRSKMSKCRNSYNGVVIVCLGAGVAQW